MVDSSSKDRLHLVVLLEGSLDGAHEGKILCSCPLFTVVEGKPCAVKGVDLTVAPPLHESAHVA
jgi:hypothetical protein